MQIKTDFPGSNIEILDMSQHLVIVRPQLKDTTTEWFYWAFCVEGAQNETWTFSFAGQNDIGYFGPAVSRDLQEWHWAGADVLDGYSRFTYRFGPDDTAVYFAHDMLYLPDRFDQLAESLALPVRKLVMSEKNNPVKMARLGSGKKTIVLTSRHHSCESTGNYVMEGMLLELIREPMKDFRVLAVPFMDIDGVLHGDQGKNRFPHDHNRDYLDEPIYLSTAALMDITRTLDVIYLIDLHSPWHFGGRHDTCFIVHAVTEMGEKYQQFSRILQDMTRSDPESIQYHMSNNIDVDVDWNVSDSPTCSRYYAQQQSVELSFIFETMYFGKAENSVTQQRLIHLGVNLAKALKKYDALCNE